MPRKSKSRRSRTCLSNLRNFLFGTEESGHDSTQYTAAGVVLPALRNVHFIVFRWCSIATKLWGRIRADCEAEAFGRHILQARCARHHGECQSYTVSLRIQYWTTSLDSRYQDSMRSVSCNGTGETILAQSSSSSDATHHPLSSWTLASHRPIALLTSSSPLHPRAAPHHWANLPQESSQM